MKKLVSNISKHRYSIILSFFSAVLFLGVACDESFDPREDNTEYFFSMYGYLDATVDTQWVRMVPVRDNFDPNTDPIDVEVRIRNVDTGDEALMSDSLFNPNPLVVMWNFWTTLEIIPEHTYEIVASLSDGRQSSTRITIPPDFPTPVYALYFGEEIIIVRDVDNVADVQAIYRVRDTFFNRELIYTFSHIRDSIRSPQGDQEKFFRLDGNRDIGLIARNFPDTEFQILDRQLFVASAGPDWINLYVLDEDIYTLAEGVSNIENGVGFMIGTITKTIPWGPCFDEQGEFIACELEKRIRQDQ